ESNNRAWEMYRDAMAVKKSGRYHTAIAEFAKIADIGAADARPGRNARAQIAAWKKPIADRRGPVAAEAKAAAENNAGANAIQLSRTASKIAPPHPAGHAGMGRIRSILHEKSKVLYTEAVLAESYSDFATARKRFEEV